MTKFPDGENEFNERCLQVFKLKKKYIKNK